MKSAVEGLGQAELFRQIGDICTSVNEVVDAEELLEISLKKIMILFQAKRGSIFVLDEQGKNLILKIAHGMKTDEARVMVKQMGEGIVGRVAELKQPVFVADINEDKRFNKYRAPGDYRTPSFICAPLMVKDKLIGVINITDKETGGRFLETDMQLLDFLSTQVALNYHRVNLYHKFKLVLKETQSLRVRLGQSDQEAEHLKKQIHVQEKFATIGKLAGGIAHEFNNPLDGVMRYTNLCLEQVSDDDVVRGYLLEIRQGLIRMANIVKNLLACSRNESPRKEKADFKTVVDHSLWQLQRDLEAKNIRVTKEIDENIPALYDLGLDQILTNLMRNSIDALDDGGHLTVKAACTDGKLIFSVSDTGYGIMAEHINSIFDPFFTTKDIDRGCGLGLTIVGEIVKSYDGNINLESEIGKGTTFTISIPVE